MTALSGPKRKYIIIGAAVLAIILCLVLIYYQFNTLTNLRSEVEEEEMAVDAASGHGNRCVDSSTTRSVSTETGEKRQPKTD